MQRLPEKTIRTMETIDELALPPPPPIEIQSTAPPPPPPPSLPRLEIEVEYFTTNSCDARTSN